ncbi:thermonuclease family protein [Cytobacillus kochii]
MKILRWLLAILTILITLSLSVVSSFGWIGLIILIFGLYQSAQKRKGKVTFNKPGMIIAFGILFTFGAAIFSPTEDVSQETSKKEVASEQTEIEGKKEETSETKEKEENALREKEAKEKAEQEAKKKAEAEQKAKEEKKEQELANSLGLEEVIVSRTVDGDTIELDDGRKIRLIGVNTPESTTKTEEYGKEASNYTATELEGKKIWMQKDVSDKDRYQRYLRIIWLSIPTDDMNEEEIRNKMFNAQLVLNGYAEPSTYPPDVKYSDYFVKFAKEARADETGLWAFSEDGTTKGDLDPKETTTTSSNETASSSGTESKKEEVTTSSQPESYKNCTELTKVYPNGVPSTHPAYASKHDRDKDNWACER